jgi:hypothetical protein
MDKNINMIYNILDFGNQFANNKMFTSIDERKISISIKKIRYLHELLKSGINCIRFL